VTIGATRKEHRKEAVAGRVREGGEERRGRGGGVGVMGDSREGGEECAGKNKQRDRQTDTEEGVGQRSQVGEGSGGRGKQGKRAQRRGGGQADEG